MKKYYIAFLGLLLTPLKQVFAISLDDFRTQIYRPENLPAPNTGDVSAEGRVLEILDFAINLILFASGSVAVLVLVIGGVMYVTSLGADDRLDQAKKLIKYAIYGLLAVILAYAAVTNITSLIYRATS